MSRPPHFDAVGKLHCKKATVDLGDCLLTDCCAGGRPRSTLSGVRLCLNTWDWDGGYRALGLQPRPFAMGGGQPGRDAKVMDDLPVITLP